MKFVFASDSFKGSLSSKKTAELLTKAASEIFEDAVCVNVPVADGGEGTVDSVIAAVNGETVNVTVHGPRLSPVKASYGKLSEDQAVLEMAAASGLTLIPEEERNPLYTTTYGTGELIKDALDKGFRKLAIAIGGSATNDGGMGCVRALGGRFLDKDGKELMGFGEDLEKVCSIDLSRLDPRIFETELTVMCDVNNLLTGPEGASLTFGPQKGASEEGLQRLEKGMQNYRQVILSEFGIDADQIPGSGAAGGLGAALTVFLHGKLRSGIETVLDLIGFDEIIRDADLIVTGEGRTDWQSAFGKVMQGVGERAKKYGIPAVGLSGSLGKDAAAIFGHGILSLMTSVNAPMTLHEAMEQAEDLYYSAAQRMFRFLKAGMMMGAGKESADTQSSSSPKP